MITADASVTRRPTATKARIEERSTFYLLLGSRNRSHYRTDERGGEEVPYTELWPIHLIRSRLLNRPHNHPGGGGEGDMIGVMLLNCSADTLAKKVSGSLPNRTVW